VKKEMSFKIIQGSNPVLLSAPHVYAHRRPSLTLSYKGAEPWTDVLVEEICANTGCWGIILQNEAKFDPNYYPLSDNEYKRELAGLVKENKIVKFLDIHGLSDEHNTDVNIFYPSRFLKSISLANDIAAGLDRGNLRGINTHILRFEDGHGETLGEFVASKLRVPSVQIELARYIREKDLLRNSFIEYLSDLLRM
jgi:hypothetical protein